MILNCFEFTYKYLEKQGFDLPTQWKHYNKRTIFDLVRKDTKFFLRNKLHYEFFSSFTDEVNEAQKNDIILHLTGIGVALDDKYFLTTNHLGRVVPKPIRNPSIVRRING